MSKNFKSLFETGRDSNATEQRFFIKEETTSGELIVPADTDAIRVLEGGGVNFSSPLDSSPDRSGRHHTKALENKEETIWSLPMFFHVDTTLGAFNVAEIDPALRVLWKSMLGREQTTPNFIYDSLIAPEITFSIFENGDVWANQASGSFVQTSTISLPGDGRSQNTWGGMSKTMVRAGILKSTTNNNTGNTITPTDTEHLDRFEVGAMVMLIEADGTTRSADTPDGSARKITSLSGGVATLDGAALADADGATSEIYMVYYEPVNFTAINDPLTGLDGTATIGGLTGSHCLRSAEIAMNNNHEVQNFCWGERGLAGSLFNPAGRLDVNVSIELNMNSEVLRFLNNRKNLPGSAVDFALGETSGRHALFTLPKVDFEVPSVSVPATGSIPIVFSGMAKQTADDAADEITVEYK